MIIMINGAFGSGKTTAAEALNKKIPNSMVFDPEEIGYMLRKVIPDEVKYKEEQTDNFQDLELWRTLVVACAKELKRKYYRTLIIPMTLYKLENYEYIRNGLGEIDSDIYHFCLTASKDTIHGRLNERGETPGEWVYRQTERCITAFEDARFEIKLDTDQMKREEVVKTILDHIKGGHLT
ncbi:AAA family ATPase [Paenibacillus gallinarum]|uniref:AAA family ATPase n=1 Tax=Paenibacillus gallinarum TaxID=2762232 RepID=A0ABR8T613_9BACL|nr:AAA family ATPase [Paenibacillus gallinarum]MBD7970724.1 AAA family ATPase [Paenibacillus gallinarum]